MPESDALVSANRWLLRLPVSRALPWPTRRMLATHCICPQRRPVLSRRTLSAISSDHCSRIRVTALLVHTMDFSTPSLVGGGSYPFFGSGGCRGGFCLERERPFLFKLWGKGERCMRLFIIKMNNNNNKKNFLDKKGGG